MKFISTVLKSSVHYFKNKKNITWILGLNIVAGVSQLIVYKLINVGLGQEQLGIWALIVTIYTFGLISNFNFSSSLVRYVPEYLVSGDDSKIEKMFGTTNSSILFISVPLLLIFYFFSIQYAKGLLNSVQLVIFSRSIIWVLSGIFFSNLFSVYACLFDGFQKFYTRCIIQISGWIIFLLSSIYFLGKYSLEGVAMAMFFQPIWQFLIAVIVIKKFVNIKKRFYLCFDKKTFKIIASFGIKSQTIGILSSLTDPVIKFFITQKMGLSGVANFEVANKITSQLRTLLVAANQVILPKAIHEISIGNFEKFLKETNKRNILYSVALGFLTLLLTPFIVYFITNKFELDLISYVIIFNIGWVLNMITSIHYYCCVALDKLNNLIYLHLAYTIMVIFLYYSSQYINVMSQWYMIIPTISLIFSSFHNVYYLRNIKGVFNWAFSKPLLLFILFSIILLILVIKVLMVI